MEPNEVLSQFVELCNTRSGFLQYHLALNAVVEWFGRTVRGSTKVDQYFRYDLCQQYEHQFGSAQTCGPIETKPVHMQTYVIKKQIFCTLINRKQIALPENKVASKDEDQRPVIETTPTQSIKSPKLSVLTQGRDFLPISDDDLNELGLAKIPEAVTPPKKNGISSVPCEGPLGKKLKYFYHEDSEVSTKNKNDPPKNGRSSEGIDSEHSQILKDKDKIAYADNYSELMYIESVGVLRLRNKTKHKGMSKHQDFQYESDIDCNYWDRDTKLKISYRIRKDNQQIQFALVIYEHITRNPTTRRNLLEEFRKTDEEEALKSAKKSKPPEVKRKIPLKRMLRLF